VRYARVVFDGTAATPLGEAAGDQTAVIATVLDAARIIAVSDAVGAMEVALDSTVAYLKSRKQFGVTLSTFQALTFRAADMYVSLETARSMAAWAAMVLAERGEDAAAVADAAARAGLKVSHAGRHLGQESIQLHGGIGMTAEYSVGAYTARLVSLEQLLGDGHHHLVGLSRRVGDHAEVDPLS
jgi:alkylation response protein AidB-like acyl-CoA dehydrogenase